MMFSREIPPRESVLAAKKLFESIAYPALMHCKSGSDRAGVMAVLYQHFRKGQTIDQAIDQFGLKYLHIREGKTDVLDHFFETYLKDGLVTAMNRRRRATRRAPGLPDVATRGQALDILGADRRNPEADPHLWRIPLMLREWCPDASLFLRPHNEEGWDLVCYVVPPARLAGRA